MADLLDFSKHGADAIILVHRAISVHTPQLVAHFNVAVTRVRLAPQRCPTGSAACAREDSHRVVFFAMAPEHLPMKELGRILLHEARHWQQDAAGNWYVLPHQCSDPFCRRPQERAGDFVYRADEAVMPLIVNALRAAGYDPDAPYASPPPQPQPIPWGKIALGVLGFVGVGVGVALAAGGNKKWDPSAGRYRDDQGRFTT